MADQPNLLFIFPDQWRGDCLGSLGHPVVETPFLDDLAQQGITFTRCYTNSPVCISARACLITGQTPARTGRYGYRDFLPWPYSRTLMTCLRDGGYQTMMAGKTHFHPPRAHLGFEQLAIYDNQRVVPGFESDYDLWLKRETNGSIVDSAQRLNSNSMVVHEWTHPEHLHANAWTTTAAIDFLDRRDPTRPFFLCAGYHRPHPPLDPPAAYYRRYAEVLLPDLPHGDWATEFDSPQRKMDPESGRLPEAMLDRARRGYYAQLSHLDFEIGRLLRWLQLRGLMNNTWVVFCSDHGEQLGDHWLYRKSTPFEGSARVPLIVRPPAGQHPRGEVRDAPVLLYDLMPTFLDLAGVPIPEQVEAQSLLPLCESPDAPPREQVHFELCHGAIGGWQAICDGRWKYIWGTQSGREWLFDLEADPQETHNLAAQMDLTGWRQRLVEILCERPEDGLVKDGQLQPGRKLPSAAEWLQT